jgi:hypothetical protein
MYYQNIGNGETIYPRPYPRSQQSASSTSSAVLERPFQVARLLHVFLRAGTRIRARTVNSGSARAGLGWCDFPVPPCPDREPIEISALPRAYPPRTRRVCPIRISSAMLVWDKRTSLANGTCGQHERQDISGIRLVTAASRWRSSVRRSMSRVVRQAG